jgi:hypothetical protein
LSSAAADPGSSAHWNPQWWHAEGNSGKWTGYGGSSYPLSSLSLPCISGQTGDAILSADFTGFAFANDGGAGSVHALASFGVKVKLQVSDPFGSPYTTIYESTPSQLRFNEWIALSPGYVEQRVDFELLPTSGTGSSIRVTWPIQLWVTSPPWAIPGFGVPFCTP